MEQDAVVRTRPTAVESLFDNQLFDSRTLLEVLSPVNSGRVQQYGISLR